MSQSSAINALADLGSVRLIEQDKVRAKCCKVINRGEKQFNVLNPAGNKVLTVVEDKDNCCRVCSCCLARDYHLWVRQNSEDRENLADIYVHRRYCTWFSCTQGCRDNMDVKIDDQKIGDVSTDCQWCWDCTPQFTVNGADGAQRFRVEEEAHCCAYFLCCGAESRFCCGIRCYIPTSLAIKGKGVPKARLEHMDGGRTHDADAYNLEFPQKSTVEDKLLLITATVAVDYKMFSSAPPPDETMKDGFQQLQEQPAGGASQAGGGAAEGKESS